MRNTAQATGKRGPGQQGRTVQLQGTESTVSRALRDTPDQSPESVTYGDLTAA